MRGFRYAGNLVPLDGPAAARREIGAIADALSREYGLRGLNGFDFILRDDRPVVVEVNPRYCASMELLERASGRSVFALHLAACRGELPARRRRAHGDLGEGDRLRFPDRHGPDPTEWLARGIRDVPHPGEVIHAGTHLHGTRLGADAVALRDRAPDRGGAAPGGMRAGPARRARSVSRRALIGDRAAARIVAWPASLSAPGCRARASTP